jgi:hypothetical protein
MDIQTRIVYTVMVMEIWGLLQQNSSSDGWVRMFRTETRFRMFT